MSGLLFRLRHQNSRKLLTTAAKLLVAKPRAPRGPCAHTQPQPRGFFWVSSPLRQQLQQPTVAQMAQQASGAPETAAAQKAVQAAELMDQVYGICRPEDSAWRPAPLQGGHKGRYLWTDAFGVVNYLSLYKATGAPSYLSQAAALVREVHDVLGYLRNGSVRLPGASEERPTAGGLRIGKTESGDDGQYFHYLTKWMYCLHGMWEATGQESYLRQALDLADVAHTRFVHNAGHAGLQRGMFWKMSIDLSHPKVLTEGHLDPYDGLVTYELLQRAALSARGQQPQSVRAAAAGPLPYSAAIGRPGGGAGQASSAAAGDAPEPSLAAALRDFNEMVEGRYRSYSSTDPLDLGEGLWLAHRQLALRPGTPWATSVTRSALDSLEELWQYGYWRQPSTRRLAFREFGATLGLQAASTHMPDLAATWAPRIDAIHSFWIQAGHLHEYDRDISPVMAAASLLPLAWLAPAGAATAGGAAKGGPDHGERLAPAGPGEKAL